MFRAARAIVQRISTLTVASVVALSSLAATAPLFLSASADAHPVSNVSYTFDRTFAWTFDHWGEHEVLSHWNGTETQGPVTTTATGVGAFALVNPHFVPTFPFVAFDKVPTQPAFALTPSEWTVAVAPGYTLVNKAVNVSGITVTVTPDNHAPSVPTLATPTDGEVRASSDSNYSTWNSSTDADGDTVTYVYQSSFASDFSTIAFEGSTGTATQIQNGGTNGLEPAGTYYWRVKAVDEHGLASAWSTSRQIIVDNTKPTITYVSPSSDNALLGSASSITVKFSDNVALDQTTVHGYLNGTTPVPSLWEHPHVSGTDHTISLPLTGLAAGSYQIRAAVTDQAGNRTQINRTFMLDTTAPTVTVKPESIGNFDANVFRSVSFKLYDAKKIDYVKLNGVTKDLSNSAWSDFNEVGKHNWYGEQEGTNTLEVFDVAGNSTTVTFVLDRNAPALTEVTANGQVLSLDSGIISEVDATSGVELAAVCTDALSPTALPWLTFGEWTVEADTRVSGYSITIPASQLVDGQTYSFTVECGDYYNYAKLNSATTTVQFTVNNPEVDNGGGGDGENEGEGGFGGGPVINPIDTAVLPQITQQVAAVNLLIASSSNASSRVFASSTTAPSTSGQVMAEETDAVDGAVEEGEDQAKMIEKSNSIFQYWWVVLIALLAIIAGIAISQRKIANKQQ